MTTVELLVYIAIACVPLSCLVVCFIVALGKKHGYRRRHDEGCPVSEERRCPFRTSCIRGGVCTFPPSKCPERFQPVTGGVHRDGDELQ